MKKFILSLLVLMQSLVWVPAFAQTSHYKEIHFDDTLTEQLFPGWKQEADEDNEGVALKGVIGDNKDKKRLFQYIPRINDLLLKFVAPVVVILCIYAGVRFIIAGKDEEEITKAKEFFIYSVIGIAFVVLSYSIMKVVYNVLATG